MESQRSDFVNMNSEAVAMMYQGDKEAAARLLWTALVGLKGQLGKPMESQPKEDASRRRGDAVSANASVDCGAAQTETEDFDMTDMEAVSHEAPPLLQSVSIPFCELSMHSTRRNENIFSFYPRAFTLAQVPENEEDATRCCCVVLYNLALIQHSRALQKKEGECPCQLLAHARSLYMGAHDIACAGLGEDDCLDLYCLQLALANNLGHIHGHSHNKEYDFSKMCDCLNGLMALIASPMSPDCVSDDDYEFFYMNLVTFQENPGLCIAPAA
ncbi:hypothetical protein SEMRO_330_G118870.1 [Seminavis robusta]|uniref:Uncharacterized protein n=1 Tax=Seminavis robusta TaxID=568900 RepID=A0A9N8DS45_9STRA|nr:hypothetical protein SEMRO_330_G118870.1 [Seminavis robusta]|eukprot:Sro330_g118870.1 n/a (271) ;mRNA; r:10240-11052